MSRDGNSPPHIIFLMADDLGWNHVSWHNPDIYTPRMEVYFLMNLYSYLITFSKNRGML